MNPLADRMRPKTLDEYIGQNHILASDKLLYKAIKSGQLFSMIFWGPPGSGKTTLARIIANEVDADFMEFSAVTTGIAELKKIFEELTKRHSGGRKPLESFIKGHEILSLPLQDNKRTIIFIDEIHRFNKAQQDAFLPYVENGTITLIGATTENPSFEIINALLSRTRVFVLNQLTRDELEQAVNRALKDKINGFGNLKIKLKKDALDYLLEGANGDARIILNTLEIAVLNCHSGKSTQPESDPGGVKLPRMTKKKISEMTSYAK
jgi:putative ATPase